MSEQPTMKRRLASPAGIAAARAYDAQNWPRGSGRGWSATTPDQAERIIVGFLLWLADELKENAP